MFNFWSTKEELLEEYKIYKHNQNKPTKSEINKSIIVKKHNKRKKSKIVIKNNNTPYKQYLKSNEWKLKKSEFYNFLKLSNLDKKCDECGSVKNLNVHHMSYENIMNEDMYDLQLLCKKCHEVKHGIGV